MIKKRLRNAEAQPLLILKCKMIKTKKEQTGSNYIVQLFLITKHKLLHSYNRHFVLYRCRNAALFSL